MVRLFASQISPSSPQVAEVHLAAVQASTCVHAPGVTASVTDFGSMSVCSCQQGIQGAALGLLGKAWSTGSACVIQNVDNLPHSLHPRTHLEGERGVQQEVLLTGAPCSMCYRPSSRWKHSGKQLADVLCIMGTGGEGVADVVYIPIYDQLTSEAGGVQGVLEVLVHSNAADPMVVANTITFVGTQLNQLQVSNRPPLAI